MHIRILPLFNCSADQLLYVSPHPHSHRHNIHWNMEYELWTEHWTCLWAKCCRRTQTHPKLWLCSIQRVSTCTCLVTDSSSNVLVHMYINLATLVVALCNILLVFRWKADFLINFRLYGKLQEQSCQAEDKLQTWLCECWCRRGSPNDRPSLQRGWCIYVSAHNTWS